MIKPLAFAFACLAFAVSALAQLDQGQVSGTVQDSSGARTPGAPLTITSKATGAERSVTTGGEGLFNVTNLPVGFYDLEVKSSGFKAYKETNIKIDTAARLSVDVVLEVGAVFEAVTVEASTVQIQKDTALIGRTVEAKQIKDLALNGSNPLNLALTKAGVVGGDFNQFNPDSLSANSYRIHNAKLTATTRRMHKR